MGPKELDDMLTVMRKHGLKKALIHETAQEDIYEFELFEYNTLTSTSKSLSDMIDREDEEKKCKCGHFEETEHSLTGCLMGCDLSLCSTRAIPA